jgi:precorrin-2 dehydrogenase/sirohydrochlorin ferrochelatase
VVGGGRVGTRKVQTLLSCGARVRVVSLEASESLRRLADRGEVVLHKRAYGPGDLEGAFLVVGATDDEELNRRISADAERLRILCNIADRPQQCSFILPSVIRRGDLVITVSTSGKSPALAKKLRRELEERYGDEYAELLELMGAIRRRLLAREHAPEEHKPIFEAIINSEILALIRQRRMEEIDRLLAEVLGEGWRAEDLLPKAD